MTVPRDSGGPGRQVDDRPRRLTLNETSSGWAGRQKYPVLQNNVGAQAQALVLFLSDREAR